MREWDIIELLSSVFGITEHDDCVLFENDEDFITLCCDMLTKDTDFPVGMTPYQIGWMCACTSLSDTAAMGAKPLGMLMGIHLPHGTDENFIKGLAEGMADCAKLSGTKVMGGDLGTQDELTICSVSVGSVKKEVCARRVGASQGDLICITGYLGDAACGLNLVLVGSKEHQHCEEYEKVLIKKALMPTPRTREGQIIAPYCSSMIDTSDGLALSLYELLRQNSVGMQLDKKSLPLSDALVACAEDHVLDMALYGAGDFELLFTVPQELISELMTEADFEIHVIGEVIEAKEVLIKTESGLERVDKRGWEIQV